MKIQGYILLLLVVFSFSTCGENDNGNKPTISQSTSVPIEMMVFKDDSKEDPLSQAYLGQAVPVTRPNIVVIMTDDLDSDALKALLDRGLMPNLKKYLIDAGFEFTQSFVTYSLCCPSRTTMLTGQYAHNHGVRSNVLPLGGATQINDSSTTATWFRSVGYRTGYIGKYLNGYGAGLSTKDAPTYIPPGWSDWKVLIDPGTYRVFDYQLNENGVVTDYPKDPPNYLNYQTDVLAQHAKAFIEKADQTNNQPFLLYVMPLAPHIESGLSQNNCQKPWDAFIRPDPKDQTEKAQQWNTILHVPLLPQQKPSFNEEDMSDKPLQLQNLPLLSQNDIDCLTRQYRSRLASMLRVDDLVGTIGSALEAKNILGNSVIVFTSDNGYLQGEHRWDGKRLAYEESIRVPLYMRVPGFTGPSRIDKIVINNDLAPTLADLAGVTPGLSVDGRSIVPLLSNPSLTSWRVRFLVESFQTDKKGREVSFSAVRTGNVPGASSVSNMIYVEHLNYNSQVDAEELYDLVTDTFQLTSRHSDPTLEQQRQTLKSWVSQMRTCSGGTCQTLENQ